MACPVSAGDRVLIRPTLDAAGSVSALIDDPQAVAMASPVRVSRDDTNIGDGAIGNTGIIDPADPNLLTTSLIQFTDPTTYSINGAGSFAYTSGDPIIINGASFEISGSPLTGDTFTLEANIGATGDNSNGLGIEIDLHLSCRTADIGN